MKLTFELQRELDLANKIPSTLNAISHIIHALPHYDEQVGINHKMNTNTHFFLSCLIGDIADEIKAYADRKIKEAKEQQ